MWQTMTSYIDLESDTGVTSYGNEEIKKKRFVLAEILVHPHYRDEKRFGWATSTSVFGCRALSKTTATRATLNAEIPSVA